MLCTSYATSIFCIHFLRKYFPPCISFMSFSLSIITIKTSSFLQFFIKIFLKRFSASLIKKKIQYLQMQIQKIQEQKINPDHFCSCTFLTPACIFFQGTVTISYLPSCDGTASSVSTFPIKSLCRDISTTLL